MNAEMVAAWAQYGIKFWYPEEHYNYTRNTETHVVGVFWDKTERAMRECPEGMSAEETWNYALRLMDNDARAHVARSTSNTAMLCLTDTVAEVVR